VPQQHLDHPDINLVFEQMGGKTVPECVQAHRLVDSGGVPGAVERPVELAGGQRIDQGDCQEFCV